MFLLSYHVVFIKWLWILASFKTQNREACTVTDEVIVNAQHIIVGDSF